MHEYNEACDDGLSTYLGGRSWTGPWVPWPSALGWGPCRSCLGWGWQLAAGGGQSRSGPADPWSCCTPTTVTQKNKIVWQNTGPLFTATFRFWNMSGCMYKLNQRIHFNLCFHLVCACLHGLEVCWSILYLKSCNLDFHIISGPGRKNALTESHIGLHKTKDCSLLHIQITCVGKQVVLWAVSLKGKRGHSIRKLHPQTTVCWIKFCWFNHL